MPSQGADSSTRSQREVTSPKTGKAIYSLSLYETGRKANVLAEGCKGVAAPTKRITPRVGVGEVLRPNL